ncbi:MAG: alpha-glucosidase [Acidobacteriaceae bacterium]|nr:alpha-glucosidase [Acidobacteriaceae bacterium]MBV9781701.1 alpha-glucosidase [Acidobacteriaceae bacterium]
MRTLRFRSSAFLAFTLTVAAMGGPRHGSAALSQSPSAQDQSDVWWKHAVIYEIYPRSFQDSNGDGIGDLNGITSRLDHLKDLGVDMIWLSPIYPSPQVDFGYDISDYEAIDPQYGTMADFDRLLDEAKKRNIRICMDMVMNHTSDKHRWFIESASSRTNPKRDWYIWRDGKSPGQPPNNWLSTFGHSAWQYDPKTKQYYYHYFYIQQPDLNWRNPEVQKAMFGAVRFWLDKGVAGFRLDAVPTLFEDPSLKDEEVQPGTNKFGDPNESTSLQENLPEVHNVMRDLRKLIDSYPGNRVLIGETYLPNVQELYKWYGDDRHDELQLPMDMQVGFINKLDVAEFRKKITDAETKIGDNQPLFVFDNHDNPRLDYRYGDGKHNTEIERMLAAILFGSRATALMYYGDEIGMTTTIPTRVEDVKDPIGKTGWPKEKGRDGERTPMQWDTSKNAGFTTSDHPWLPVPPDYKTINVAVEKPKSDSLLSWYKRLIALRREVPALHSGKEMMLNTNDNHVLSWLRQTEGHPPVLIACNFTANPQTVSFNLAQDGVTGKHPSTLLKSPGARDPASLDKIQLPPFGVYIGEVK